MATATRPETPPGVSPDREHILFALKTLIPEGHVTELRALNVPERNGFRPTHSGYFDDHAKLASEAARLSKLGAEGVYFIPNVVKPDLLARAANHTKIAKQGESTSETGILQRRYLLIDCDPVRDSGISSTYEEHTIAIERAQGVMQALRKDGWPDPIVADSGNGGHVLYPIDLPAKDGGLVKRCLEALAFRFSDEHVVIDQKCSDPNRIWKLYGTVARKGDSIPQRPHRMARLLSVPAVQEVVSRELLEELAASLPQPERQSQRSASVYDGPAFDLEEWIAKHNLEVAFSGWEKGHKWVFRVCPWNSEHTDRSAYIVRFTDGAIAAGCHHNGCKGKTWADLRALYDKHNAVVMPFPTKRQEREEREDADESPAGETAKNDEPTDKESQQDILIRLGLASATFFRTSRGTFHAEVQVHGRREVYSLPERGGDFRAWLVNQYGKLYNRAPGSTAVAQAMDFFRARARFDGEVHEIYTRVAAHAGKLYIDIGSATWDCIEVDAKGWRIIPHAPVYFRRPESMGVLPYPVRGGSVDELRPFVNVKTDEQWYLAVGWLLGTLHPTGPYAHCEISGPQGSAKTSATRYMRGVIDPGKPAVRRAPKDPDDFMIGAGNSWVLALDNLSSIPDWLSDLLATLATGAGSGKRTLYTDDGETIFDARRPAIFNGIADLATRGDLQERTVRIELTRPVKRKTETKMDAAYAKVQPRILGALLDAASCALRRLSDIDPDNLPRMADFAQWVTAAEPALGWESGTFLRIFGENQADSAGTVFDADPVAQAVRAFMADKDEWRGRASHLLALLGAHAPHGSDAPNWPKGANSLVTKLRRIMPALNVAGISVETYRTRDGSIVTLTKTTTCDDPSDGDRHTSSQGSSHPHSSTYATCDDRDDCDDLPPTSFVERHPQELSEEVDITVKNTGVHDKQTTEVGERPSQPSQSSQPPKRACYICHAQQWVWNGNQWTCGNPTHAESEK